MGSMIGKVIRERRELRGWTQEQLAHESGLPQSYISNLERGARRGSIEAFQAIARALHIPLAEIFQVTTQQGTEISVPQDPSPDIPDPLVGEILDIWPDLTPEDRDAVLAMHHALLTRYRRKTPKQGIG